MTITPRTGTIHHLQLTVTNTAVSGEFYKLVLVELLGYRQNPVPESEYAVFRHHGTEIFLEASKGKDVHNRFNPGLHHLAFRVDSRQMVDIAYQRMRTCIEDELGSAKERARILDAPAEYPEYGEGYYAFFFTDPDGIKLEIVYDPALSD